MTSDLRAIRHFSLNRDLEPIACVFILHWQSRLGLIKPTTCPPPTLLQHSTFKITIYYQFCFNPNRPAGLPAESTGARPSPDASLPPLCLSLSPFPGRLTRRPSSGPARSPAARARAHPCTTKLECPSQEPYCINILHVQYPHMQRYSTPVPYNYNIYIHTYTYTLVYIHTCTHIYAHISP